MYMYTHKAKLCPDAECFKLRVYRLKLGLTIFIQNTTSIHVQVWTEHTQERIHGGTKDDCHTLLNLFRKWKKQLRGAARLNQCITATTIEKDGASETDQLFCPDYHKDWSKMLLVLQETRPLSDVLSLLSIPSSESFPLSSRASRAFSSDIFQLQTSSRGGMYTSNVKQAVAAWNIKSTLA